MEPREPRQRGNSLRETLELREARRIILATEETYHHGYTRRERAAEYQKEVLAFNLGPEEYALDIQRIREIIKTRPVTEVPRAPGFVMGIISVRGQVIPVMDLRLRLKLPAAPPGREARVLIVTRDGEAHGLLVDRVRQVVRMRDEEIEPPPPMLGTGEAEFLFGIGRPREDRMIIVLNADAVLAYTALVPTGAAGVAAAALPGPAGGVRK
jgi:purine-binding chemotaxis protein CheW